MYRNISRKFLILFIFSISCSFALFGLQPPHRDATSSPPPPGAGAPLILGAALAFGGSGSSSGTVVSQGLQPRITFFLPRIHQQSQLGNSSQVSMGSPVLAVLPQKRVHNTPMGPMASMVLATPSAAVAPRHFFDTPTLHRTPDVHCAPGLQVVTAQGVIAFTDPRLQEIALAIDNLLPILVAPGGQVQAMEQQLQRIRELVLQADLSLLVAAAPPQAMIEHFLFLVALLHAYRSVLHGTDIPDIELYKERLRVAFVLRETAQIIFDSLKNRVIDPILSAPAPVPGTADALKIEALRDVYNQLHDYAYLFKLGDLSCDWYAYSGVYYDLLWLIKRMKIKLLTIKPLGLKTDAVFDNITIFLDEHECYLETSTPVNPEAFGGGHMDRVHDGLVCSRSLTSPLVPEFCVHKSAVCLRDCRQGLKCAYWPICRGGREELFKGSTLWPRCYTHNLLRYFDAIGRACAGIGVVTLRKVGETRLDEFNLKKVMYFMHAHRLDVGSLVHTCDEDPENCPLKRRGLPLDQTVLIAVSCDKMRVDTSNDPTHVITVIKSAYPLICINSDNPMVMNELHNHFEVFPPPQLGVPLTDPSMVRFIPQTPDLGDRLQREARVLWTFGGHCRIACTRVAIDHVAAVVGGVVKDFAGRLTPTLLDAKIELLKKKRSGAEQEDVLKINSGLALLAAAKALNDSSSPTKIADFDKRCQVCAQNVFTDVVTLPRYLGKPFVDDAVEAMLVVVRRVICHEPGAPVDVEKCRKGLISLCGLFVRFLQKPVVPHALPAAMTNTPVLDYAERPLAPGRPMVMISLNYENYFPALQLRDPSQGSDPRFTLLDRNYPDRGPFAMVTMLLPEERLLGEARDILLHQNCLFPVPSEVAQERFFTLS